MHFMNVTELAPTLLGHEGERFAKQQFEAAGYVVSIPTEKRNGDLRIKDPKTGQVMKVEVKTSRNGVDGRWQFCITRRAGKRNKTDCTHADAVLLQAVNRVTGLVMTYIIPSNVLAGQAILRMSRAGSAKGKWEQYRVADYAVMGGVQ